jgi:hypothetical protein
MNQRPQLPYCRHRGGQLDVDRWQCHSPRLVVPQTGVHAEHCLRRCPYADTAVAGERAAAQWRASSPGVRFVRRTHQTIGNGVHRSGWPYAFRSLQPLSQEGGVLLDDFVEQTFCYQTRPEAYREPWVGIFHHPPDMPSFANRIEMLSHLFQRPVWQRSEASLRGAIALSEHLAAYLREALHVPVAVVRHPSEVPDVVWDEAAYLDNLDRSLVQLGWYLRNTRAIFQVPPLVSHRKLRVWPTFPWVQDYDRTVRDYWAQRAQRIESGEVTQIQLLDTQRYDQLLARHVVLTELFAASANNVVIECIARCTPIVVNRHPAVTEYLGTDYPLYFDRIEEVPQLLQTERVIDAHRYLRNLDRSWLAGDAFRRDIQRAVHSFMPSASHAPATGCTRPPSLATSSNTPVS